MSAIEKTRFDIRLSKEQKDFFEYAAGLLGSRSLTDFFISSVQEKARKIIAEHEIILASKKDKELFFNALLDTVEPNEKLKRAAERFNNELNK